MKTRKLWDVWKEGRVWMLQGPNALAHFFFTRRSAFVIAERAKALAAIEKKKIARSLTSSNGGR